MDEIRPRANTKDAVSITEHFFSTGSREFRKQEIREEPARNSHYIVTLCEIKYLGISYIISELKIQDMGTKKSGHPLKHLLTGFAHADARGGSVQWREVQFVEEYVVTS